VVSRRLASLVFLFPLFLTGCATGTGDHTPLAREKTVADQVLAFDSSKEAGGDSSCRSRKISSTEVTLPFESGSQGAAGYWTERWTVDRCGRLIPYMVSFVRATDGHLGVGILRLEGIERAVIPGSTIADPTLQRDTFMLLAQKDLSELEGGPCRTRKVTNTEVVSPLVDGQIDGGKPVGGQWAERWTLDRCGASIHYIIRFVTTRTGTTFITERETARAPVAAPTQPLPPAAPRVERGEPAPAPGTTTPRQPAVNAPEDSGAAIDWLLKPRPVEGGKK
jgi:hypothetical protein